MVITRWHIWKDFGLQFLNISPFKLYSINSLATQPLMGRWSTTNIWLFFNGKWSKFGSGKIMHYNMAHHDMAHSMKARNFVDKMGYSMISYGKRMRIIHDFLNLLLWEIIKSSVKIPQLLISTIFNFINSRCLHPSLFSSDKSLSEDDIWEYL